MNAVVSRDPGRSTDQMGVGTSIEWVTATWNPLTGCTKISPGCKNCYAERMSGRLKLMGQRNYANGFALATHDHMLDRPLRWRKPERVFVNSMSDLYHRDVPEAFIQRVFATMRRADWHTFKILTKRADRLEELSPRLPWTANIWQGVSVENADYTFRIDHLRRTGAHTKFLSVEPLLGPIPDLDLRGIDWVIVGGESGPGCRPMAVEWVADIRAACERQGVALFVKQTDERLARQLKLKNKKGGDPDEWPAELRVRQFPRTLPVVAD
jgi:protein gp37